MLSTRITKGLVKLKSCGKNKRKIIAFDCETINVKCEGYVRNDFLMCCVTDGKDFWTFWNKEEARDFLTSRKCQGAIVYATNLDFDLHRL